MKTVLVVILITIFAALVWYSWPIFTAELGCYDTANDTETTIQMRLVSASWSKRQFCEAEFAKLDTLNTCLVKINSLKINSLQKYLDPYFGNFFHLLRPTIKYYDQQKSDYNQDCQDFQYILIP